MVCRSGEPPEQGGAPEVGWFLQIKRMLSLPKTSKHIGSHVAKVVSPRTPGRGTTGAYFPKVGGRNSLSIWGKELSAAQQELVLKMFEPFDSAVPCLRFSFRHSRRPQQNAMNACLDSEWVSDSLRTPVG
jgi:hypothetical protein